MYHFSPFLFLAIVTQSGSVIAVQSALGSTISPVLSPVLILQIFKEVNTWKFLCTVSCPVNHCSHDLMIII